ncbi:PRC-barrel domain-containing protein (plasmid) [Tistrella bauzanensis]|jgi:sporulation protein YlmC with PRC-barrel domain|uniref:PRC-barrel domain-containing protein n=1 Tax=Tistrella arctica TaxID=3133430 RepID=A0ABU9YP01_9PROT
MATPATTETSNLISADRVEGTSVYGADGEKIGSIYGLMLNKLSGKVAYAVVSFGGFLGIGEKYHPLPWDVLKYDTSKDGYVVGLTRDQLENAPTYDRGDERRLYDRDYEARVHSHYGTAPYWL